MKVLVVGTGGSIVSGISTAADQMARTLTGFGHDVERLNAGERMRRRSNTLNLENVRAVLGDVLAVLRRARAGRADVVWIHIHGAPALAALRALAMAAAARLAGSSALVQFHAFGLEAFVADGSRAFRTSLRGVLALATGTVVLHEAAADALRSLGGAPRLHVLPNWVDVPDAAPALPPQPPLRAVFVGGLVRRKGVPELLDALRALDGAPVELRLVGGAGEDGPEALERLRAGAADLVGSGRVSFAGERDAEGVRAELRAAHLFVLPSAAEGMPMSMLEAEGRPALVSDAGNMGSVVEDAGCGWLLPDRRPATIVACLRGIAEDAEGLASASAGAWQAARAHHSAEARRPTIEAILSSPGRQDRRRLTAPGLPGRRR